MLAKLKGVVLPRACARVEPAELFAGDEYYNLMSKRKGVSMETAETGLDPPLVRRQHTRRCNSRNQLPEEPFPSTVINLSGSQLSDAEIALLSKGLSFCPTPPSVNTEQLRDDFERFFRHIRLKKFLSDRASEEDSHPFKPPSIWMPLRGRNVALRSVRQNSQTRNGDDNRKTGQHYHYRQSITK